MEIEKKVIESFPGVIALNGEDKETEIGIMAARFTDGSRTLTIGTDTHFVTVDVDHVNEMLEKLSGC